MNIEIVEFYPFERQEKMLSGTLRIRLVNFGIHILGVFASYKKGHWFFQLPSRIGTNHETGEAVRFPFIVFEDREKQNELMTAIREKAVPFIESRLADTENPLVFPERKKEEKKPLQQTKKQEKTEAKKTEAPQIPKMTQKVWVDLPKRTQKKPCSA